MGKLLVYAGIGFGVVFSFVLVGMLVLQQPVTRSAAAPPPTTSADQAADPAAAPTETSTETSTEGSSTNAQARRGIDAETKTRLEGLGFRVFDNPPQAEEFVLQTLDRGELRLSEFEGKVVLMNFWATWCPPCIEEMPSMQRLYESLPREQFEILAINMQEDRETVQRFISEHNFEYPILLDYAGAVARRYAVRGLPTSYVIAPDGSMPAALIGFAHWDEPGYVEFFHDLTSAPDAPR